MKSYREKVEAAVFGLFSVWLTWVSFTLVDQNGDLRELKHDVRFLIDQKNFTRFVPAQKSDRESSEKEIQDNG